MLSKAKKKVTIAYEVGSGQPYIKKNIKTHTNIVGKDQLKDPYIVEGDYVHNFKTMWFNRNQLCMLRAKIPTPEGIKHIVLPVGKVNKTLNELKKLSDEEFKTISDFELGITLNSTKTRYTQKDTIIWDDYNEEKNKVRYIIQTLDIDNKDILRYVLFSLQGDRNKSPFLGLTLYGDEYKKMKKETLKQWDSCLPKYMYEQYMQLRNELKEKISKEVRNELQKEYDSLSTKQAQYEQEVRQLKAISQEFKTRQIEHFNNLCNSSNSSEDLHIIDKKLRNLKKENKEAFQLLCRLCHFADNTNINSFIQKNSEIKKYLALYKKYGIIQKTHVNKQEKEIAIYAINDVMHHALLNFITYSLRKTPKKRMNDEVKSNINQRRLSDPSPRNFEHKDSLRKVSSATDLTPRSRTAQSELIKQIVHGQLKQGNRIQETKSKKRSPKRRKRHSRSNSSSSSPHSSPKHVTPKTKKKFAVTPLKLPQSPREKRSNTIADPITPHREKLTPRERSKTDGNVTQTHKIKTD